MKNISDNDGLSREKRLKRALSPVVLPVLEERFSVLLNRALKQSDFTSVYKFQSLVILLEIELFDADSAEEAFMHLSEPEQFVSSIYGLAMKMDDWCKRLEYACLSGKSIALLKDLSGQISTNISPLFSAFYKQHANYPEGIPRQIWFSPKDKIREEGMEDDFPRRLYLLLVSSIRLLQSKSEVYREEIYSSGKMDPSLAVIVAFLQNYGDIAASYNARWQSLPMFYLDNILKVFRRKQLAGTTWLAFESSPVGVGTVLHKNSFWKAEKDNLAPGYKLLSDMRLTQMSLAGMKVVVMEKNKERYPEAALSYVTSIKQSVYPDKEFVPGSLGFCLRSPLFQLGEGKREVNVLFGLTTASLNFMNENFEKVGIVQEISKDEAVFKSLHDAFHLSISTLNGWEAVESFYLRFEEGKGIRLTFRLSEEFPAMEPLEGERLPALRLLVNSAAWLFPYSWARQMFIESIRITVNVQGIRDIRMYNDLGRVDVNQAFSPFGIRGEKGAWLALGSYEMACKPVKTVDFSFNWQHLPICKGGLKEHYRAYDRNIDNCSFRGRVDQLRSRGWKPLVDSDSCYLFRTSSKSVPQKEGPLAEHTTIHFSVLENTVLPLGRSDKFRLADVHSGFYRLVLTDPEMGLGTSEYRRLFAEIMIYNSHARRKKTLPEEPLSLLMDSPQLGYVAEDECFFDVGSSSDISFSYIRPLSNDVNELPDTSHPIALLEGPEDEGNLLIGIRGAVGENLICMYLDMKLLQREIDHEFLPQADWYYRDASRWIQIDAVNVLRDDTGGLMHSGAVKLQFPFRISQDMVDAGGVFWICVAVHSYFCNCSRVQEVYLNVAEAIPTQVEEPQLSVSGLLSYKRVAPIGGSRPEEDEVEIRTRMSERIASRHRLLLADEYEQMTLQEFPEVAKVKCFPGIDAKQQNRNPIVTLAAVCTRTGEAYPLCTDELLCRIEDCLRQYASPFVRIDVINPVYEEVTVFCGISLKKDENSNLVIQDVYEALETCIAPWDKFGEVPAFGYSFSLRDMQSRIKEGGKVSMVHGMKLLQVVSRNDGTYSLREYILTDGEEQVVTPSNPWSILVSAPRHYVKLVTEDEWRREIEIGDFEVENTFVIK